MEEKRQPIKVVFALSGAVLGGVERHLARQLRYFDRQRFDISIVILFGAAAPADQSVFPPDVSVTELSVRGLKDVGGLARLWRYLRAQDPDLVVSSAYDANTLIRLLKPFFRYTALPREHNLYPHKSLRQRLTDRLLSYLCPTIVCVSEGVADAAAAQAHIPRQKFTVIQNGIDLSEVAAFEAEHPDPGALKRQLGYGDRPVVVTVGRLREQKNHALMIEAFAEFKRLRPDSSHVLAIVGQGGERAALEALARERKLEEDVVFADPRTPFEHYRVADLFLLTSRREGFPNVVLEALAFGVPVVSVPLPGVLECVRDGENGLIAQPHAGALAEALARMAGLSSDERERFRAACLATAQHYRMEENVRKYEALFMRILKHSA